MKPDVRPFLHRDSATFSYVVSDPSSGASAIVDPVLDFEPRSGRTGTASAEHILAFVQDHGLDVQWILETHAHADHLSAAHWLRSEAGGQIAIGAGILDVLKTFRPVFGLGEDAPADGSQFDRLLADGERLALGALEVQVIATPGHTPDSVSYLVGDALFGGDTLFMPDVGTARCDFPGGDAATLYRSIRRLLSLPRDTRLLVCHDYPPDGREWRFETTVGEQRSDNVHAHEGVDEDAFVERRRTRDAGLPVPALLLPALQVNLRAGALPAAESNGVRYLKLPLNQF